MFVIQSGESRDDGYVCLEERQTGNLYNLEANVRGPGQSTAPAWGKASQIVGSGRELGDG